MKAVGPWARRIAFILPLAGMLAFAISFCAVSYSTAQRLADDGMGGLRDGMGRIAYRPLRIGDEGLVGDWEVISVEERGSAEPFVKKGDFLGFNYDYDDNGKMFLEFDVDSASGIGISFAEDEIESIVIL